MSGSRNIIGKIILWVAIIVADIFIFVVLGLLQMQYDDFYDESKGEYWSLASMNMQEKIYYFALQFWIILNIIGLVYIGRKIYKRIKNKKWNTNFKESWIVKKFNWLIFLVCSFIFIFLLFPSFVAAWSEDEGTLGTNIIAKVLPRVYDILRFPTHTLFWNSIIGSNDAIYYLGLVLNCFFYGFITERLIFILKNLRHKKWNTKF